MSEAAARHWFEKHQLPFPPFPDELASRLDEVANACFSTFDADPASLYLFQPSAHELLVDPGEPHAAVSFSGHGVNSYAITVRLLTDKVRVIMQVGWGGGYTDNAAAAVLLAARYDDLARVLALAEQQDAEGWWTLISSDMRSFGACGRLEAPAADDAAARRWLRDHAEEDPFATSIALLSGSSGSTS